MAFVFVSLSYSEKHPFTYEEKRLLFKKVWDSFCIIIQETLVYLVWTRQYVGYKEFKNEQEGIIVL